MNGWGAGYVTDVSYIPGVYREQTPAILNLAGLASGIVTPKLDGALSYCELGCGLGYSANLVAAANPNIEVHANDFNPAHIVGAQSFAAEAGIDNVHFRDSSFAEFAADPTLPDFDIITLHGIYSWISAENRGHIVDFIRARLKPGGLVYISYNTQPGWAALMPLRRLIADFADAALGSSAARLAQALEQVQGLVDVDPGYFRINSGIAGTLQAIKGQNRNYVIHEYLNRDAIPFYFADVAAELSEAKLSYASSAHLLDNVDAVNLTPEQQAVLGTAATAIQREMLRDYMVNQRFRRDMFIRGAVPLSPAASRERWTAMRFVLTTPRDEVPLTVKGAQGEATLQEEIYVPLLDVLADGPLTVGQLLMHSNLAAIGWERLLQALMVLVGTGHLQPALDEAGDARRRIGTAAFNSAVLNAARSSDAMQYLASPVSGGPVPLDRVSQLFLLARHKGQADAPALVWDVLRNEGIQLMKDDRPLETPEENLTELRALFQAFNDKHVPRLAALGIAEPVLSALSRSAAV